jgi:type II secretory pathway component PulL
MKALFFDMVSEECRAYLFEGKPGRYELRETKTYPLTAQYQFAPETVSEDVEHVYVSLPVSLLNYRVLDLPFSGKEKVRDVLPYELDGLVLDGIEHVLFDDIQLSSTQDTHKVLAVYIEKKTIRELLNTLKPMNIDPVFITSLELGHIVQDFRIENLYSPVVLDEQERISLAAEEIQKPTINLRRDEFVYTRDIETSRKSLRITMILALILGFIIASDLVLKIVAGKNEINTLRNEMRKTYQQVFPSEKNIVNELHQFKAHMKELRDREEYFLGAKPLDTLSHLSKVDRQLAVFDELQVDRDMLLMKGHAPSLSMIQELKDGLEQTFSEVEIADSKASADGSMLFTVTAREKAL